MNVVGSFTVATSYAPFSVTDQPPSKMQLITGIGVNKLYIIPVDGV